MVRPPHDEFPRGNEGRSVLAVLLLAAVWPERFPGGWVGIGDFGRCGLYLGERTSLESLRAAVRRGLRQIRQAMRLEITERRHPEGPEAAIASRGLQRRLVAFPRSELRDWLHEQGHGWCSPEIWAEFGQASTIGGPVRIIVREENAALWLSVAGACLMAAHVACPPAALPLQPIRRALRRVERRFTRYSNRTA